MLVWIIIFGALIGTVYGQSENIGGNDTLVSQHRFQVYLQTSSGDSFCSGFLIPPTWVVTAAQCVYDLDPSTTKTYRFRDGRLVWIITVDTVIGAIHGQSKIIEGKDTLVSQHRFQVSLQTSSADNFCSGFLISQTWVVTAAQCINDQDPSTIETYRFRADSLAWIVIVSRIMSTVYGQSKIIGGKDALIHKHRYQVSLQTFSGDHFCSGFLISRTWVVTAAQCVYGQDPSTIKSYRIHAGSIFYNIGHTVQVQKAIVHPDYSPSTLDSDIALLQLASSVSNKARPAVLPQQVENIRNHEEVISYGTILEVTGWGVTKEGGNISERLQVFNVGTVEHSGCKAKYIKKNRNVTHSMMCATRLGGACSRDVGSPAVQGWNTIVQGIVSWGFNCDESQQYPSVFTQVSIFSDWIKDNSGI